MNRLDDERWQLSRRHDFFALLPVSGKPLWWHIDMPCTDDLEWLRFYDVRLLSQAGPQQTIDSLL